MGLAAIITGFILAYWILGLLVNSFLYTQYIKLTHKRWDALDPDNVGHVIWLSLSAIVWPLAVATIICIIVGTGFIYAARFIVRKAIEGR